MTDYRVMSLINGGARVYVFRSGIRETVAINDFELSPEKFKQIQALLGGL